MPGVFTRASNALSVIANHKVDLKDSNKEVKLVNAGHDVSPLRLKLFDKAKSFVSSVMETAFCFLGPIFHLSRLTYETVKCFSVEGERDYSGIKREAGNLLRDPLTILANVLNIPASLAAMIETPIHHAFCGNEARNEGQRVLADNQGVAVFDNPLARIDPALINRDRLMGGVDNQQAPMGMGDRATVFLIRDENLEDPSASLLPTDTSQLADTNQRQQGGDGRV